MKPLTVVIADDQPINLKLLMAQLEAEGHRVLPAADGSEAMRILERNRVDLVISDILMPVMDGYRLCAAVRRSERHADVPFIFYTATYTSPADEQLCLELGADKYLRKPVSIHELLDAIDEAVSAPRRPSTVSLEGDDILKEYSERLVFKLEQKNLELSAASDQLRLQATALDTAGEAIVITDADGVVSWVNRAFCTVTGFSPDGAIGRGIADLDVGLPDSMFRGSFWTEPDGELWRGEAVLRHKTGSIHDEELSVTPVRGADGMVTHLVGVMHDITDRKRTAKQLHEANARLRQLLDHSPAVLYALRVEDRRVVPFLVSENVTRLLGFPPDEVLNVEWFLDHVHPDDRKNTEAMVAQTLKLGASHAEYRVRHWDGGYRWVEDNQRVVADSAGRPPELVGVWTDISERKRAADDLRRSELRFREMLDNLELVSLMLDRDARITYCNDYFLRLTGWQRDEVLGRDWFQLFVPPEQVEEMRAIFLSLVADLPHAWHHTNEILTRAGERRIVHWNNSVLRSPVGEVIGTASVAEDITERKHLERQSLRAQRLESLGTLAGGIAHDLNNLLMPILMGATLLKRLGPDPRGLAAIENIERSVKRGSDLVKQVLLFARGGDSSPSSVQLGDVIAEVEAIARSTFPKDITFHVSASSDMSPVSADATQLTQVLLNLCVNARDAMPHGGRIGIAASSAAITDRFAVLNGGTVGGEHVILEVTDTGDGMSKETIERIFDPFFTTKEVGKGTGLGLATVQGIVRSHAGFLTVSSTPGHGSTFRVYLPALPKKPSAMADGSVARPLPPGNGEVILVVDDDASVLGMTRETLEAFGYHVITAEDGAQAVGLFSRRQNEIAAVLTDLVMPILDGPALIAALLRIDPDVKIIAATGDPSPSLTSKVARADVKQILFKPFSADELLVSLYQVLHDVPLG